MHILRFKLRYQDVNTDTSPLKGNFRIGSYENNSRIFQDNQAYLN